MDIVKSQRGNKTLKYNNDIFYMSFKRCDGSIRWRCRQYKSVHGCEASIEMNSVGEVVSVINNTHNHGMKRSVTNDVAESEFQDGSGISKLTAKPISPNDDSWGTDLKRQSALHCDTDQSENDCRCARNDIDNSTKTKVVNIFRCLQGLTDRQKKGIKNLLCRFELSSDINCASNCELICKNKRYKNSNMYEIIYYSIYKICCEKNDDLSIDGDYGANRLKRNKDYDSDDDGDGVSYDENHDDENDDDEETELENESEESDDMGDDRIRDECESEESDDTDRCDAESEESDNRDDDLNNDEYNDVGSDESDDRNDDRNDDGERNDVSEESDYRDNDRNDHRDSDDESEESDYRDDDKHSRCTGDDDLKVVWEVCKVNDEEGSVEDDDDEESESDDSGGGYDTNDIVDVVWECLGV